MAGRIPSHFIDELINRVDIVDLIGERVSLKKAGKDFQACCPFHDEKTPSFTVSRDKQFYHCFGCGAHGTAIGFLMEYERMEFPEAIEELALREGLEVPYEQGGKGRSSGPDLRPLYEIMDRCAHFYQQQLRSHSDATRATDYLKQRGLDGETARDFAIGFAPPGWNQLGHYFANQPAALASLKTAGMLSESEQKQYDRFRDRIMFPIRDHRGRTIAFGGRILGEDKPKYLNSPETPLFHKSRQLYGLFEARQAVRKLEHLLVVEGYMDVVALAQFGIRYAVATLGTAVTSEHIEQLFRNVPVIIFCFDGDQAGRNAGWKALETSLALMRDGREARFLFLPEGEDPDTLIRKEGSARFEKRIVEATPLSSFLFNKLAQNMNLDTPDGRSRLVEQAAPLLQRLPDGAFRQMMTQQLAGLAGLPQISLDRPSKTTAPHSTEKRRPTQATGLHSPVRRAIALLLQHPDLGRLDDLPEGWEASQQPGIDLLHDLLELCKTQPQLTMANLLERWRDTQTGEHLQRLAQLRLGILEDDLKDHWIGTLQQLLKRAHDEEWEELTQKESGSLTAKERSRLQELTVLKQQRGR